MVPLSKYVVVRAEVQNVTKVLKTESKAVIRAIPRLSPMLSGYQSNATPSLPRLYIIQAIAHPSPPFNVVRISGAIRKSGGVNTLAI